MSTLKLILIAFNIILLTVISFSFINKGDQPIAVINYVIMCSCIALNFIVLMISRKSKA